MHRLHFRPSMRRATPHRIIHEARYLPEKTVSEASFPPATPTGGVRRMYLRVMNLAHLITQNSRRHGDRVGFIIGDRSCSWREIDFHVSALASALSARGIVKG